jgi:dephospho-CoA kinase
MLVIGITGGVASGKSLVASQLEKLGARVLDADKAGHEVLNLPDVMEALRNKWGDRVFENDTVNRKQLATIVFENTEQGDRDLAFLEALTHPRIRQILVRQLSRLEKQPDIPAVILDAPILFKAGWDQLCDKIVFVNAPAAIRQIRAVEKRNWNSDELAKRENRQLALDQKRSRASDFIDNFATVAACQKQVAAMWSSWGLSLPNPS